jgi:hypothetical protein
MNLSNPVQYEAKNKTVKRLSCRRICNVVENIPLPYRLRNRITAQPFLQNAGNLPL